MLRLKDIFVSLLDLLLSGLPVLEYLNHDGLLADELYLLSSNPSSCVSSVRESIRLPPFDRGERKKHCVDVISLKIPLCSRRARSKCGRGLIVSNALRVGRPSAGLPLPTQTAKRSLSRGRMPIQSLSSPVYFERTGFVPSILPDRSLSRRAASIRESSEIS